MKSTLDQVEDIKNHGYNLDISAVINHAFENFKKISLYSALIIFIFSFIFGIAILGIIGAIFGVASISKDLVEQFQPQNLSYTELLITTLGVSLVTALLAPFAAGFLKMADCADKDEEFNVSTIFSYYSAPYFAQIFVATLIIAGVSSAISNAIESSGLLFVGGIFSFFISFFTYLTIPFIIFGNLQAIDAIKSSFIVVARNPILIFAAFIVGFFGSMVGLFACCIGILFTLAFNTSMTYATYHAIFSIEEEDPINSIGQSDLE